MAKKSTAGSGWINKIFGKDKEVKEYQQYYRLKTGEISEVNLSVLRCTKTGQIMLKLPVIYMNDVQVGPIKLRFRDFEAKMLIEELQALLKEDRDRITIKKEEKKK